MISRGGTPRNISTTRVDRADTEPSTDGLMLARRNNRRRHARGNNLTTPGPTAAALLQSRRDHVSSSSPLTYHAYAPQCTHGRLRRRTSTLTHESTHNSHLQLRRQYRRARERPVGDPCASVGTFETSGVLRHPRAGFVRMFQLCVHFDTSQVPHHTHTHHASDTEGYRVPFPQPWDHGTCMSHACCGWC